MTRTPFNTGWAVRPKVTAFQELGGSDGEDWRAVTLPHDALLETQRCADAPGGHTNGYFKGGAFEYRRILDVNAEQRGKLMFLEFDGVYRDAVVTVNGALAGRWANGYSRFTVRIDPFLRFGQDNEIRVACRTHLDSRWYAGAGIYRDVHLVEKEPVHLALDGVRVSTISMDEQFATVEVSARVLNSSAITTTSRLTATLEDASGAAVAERNSPITLLPGDEDVVRLRMMVESPQLWSAETPTLYKSSFSLANEAGEIVDDVSVPFGIRSIQVDALRGLRVNGQPVKLRGACIHSDNGPLGVAAIRGAEERKIARLKAA
jgi:beta-galactosidase